VRPATRNPWILVASLCLAAGLSNIDQFGISYVAPFIQRSLHFDDTQIGVLLASFWLTFSISNYVTGVVADRTRSHKRMLVLLLLLFASGSVAPALTSVFATLLAARLVMGVFDASVYLLPQSIVMLETPVERHGLNMGIVQNLGGAFFGMVIAPLLLVWLAGTFGWRAAFLVVAFPGIACAMLVARHAPPRPSREAVRRERALDPASGANLGQLLRIRNVWLSAVISCFIIGYLTMGLGFLPLYLVNAAHFAASRMSLVVSVMGLAGAVLGIVLPAASDRVGRKPVMLLSSVLGLGMPLAVLYYTGPLPVLCALVFVGSALFGAAPLTFAAIPCESAPAAATSTVIGIILAIGALVGGVAGPAAAGWCADRWGLAAPLYLTIGCCVGVSLASTALVESAPRRRRAFVV